MFAFYSLVPVVLKRHGAALLNLSLLAADAWTGLARGLLLDGFPPGALAPFLACFAVTGAGIVLFASAEEAGQLGAKYDGTDAERGHLSLRTSDHASTRFSEHALSSSEMSPLVRDATAEPGPFH